MELTEYDSRNGCPDSNWTEFDYKALLEDSDSEDDSTFEQSDKTNVIVLIRFNAKTERIIFMLCMYSHLCSQLYYSNQPRSFGLLIALENEPAYKEAYYQIIALYSYKNYKEIVFHLLYFDAFHNGHSAIHIRNLSQNCFCLLCREWYKNSTSNLPPGFCKVLRPLKTVNEEEVVPDIDDNTIVSLADEELEDPYIIFT